MATISSDTTTLSATAPRVGVPPLRLHVIKAIFERNFLAYYSSPLGYVFITLFILVSAAAAFWQPAFFSNNLAGLATLNSWMPYILLVFVPAITMNVWAEERRQGTDELLLTLPAGDLEIVLGKYLAALGIYTAALVFSTSLVGILSWLGRPDLGVVLATYLGYWLMGALMIAIGMVASILSSNVTIAFILGAAFSAIPVFFGLFGSPFAPGTRRAIEDLSLPSQFADFGNGVVPLVGIFYFVTLAAAMLYLNVVLLGRRHWAGGERSRGLGLHAVVRAISLIAALVSVDILLSRYVNARWDWSSEGLHRLSEESARLISEIPSDRPVFIQAYYSEEVPRDYVQTKIDLLNKLREFAALGGDRIRLNLVPTEIYSEAAREAETRFGIQPRRVVGMESARQTASEIYLAVAFNSGLEEVVIPFFDRGLSVEYELTRAIRVVSRSARKKVGILNTDARLIGGLDFRSMNQDADWPIVTELRRQFEVSQVSPDSPIPSDIDVLLVAQPSSLTTPQIANLTEHVRAGKPTLIFVDPLPLVDPGISPELPKTPPGGMFGGGQQPEPKGSLEPLTTLLGIDWPASQIVFNPYSPHPMLGDLPPEVVFISRGGAGEDAFNESQSATSGLQEIVMMFPGLLRMRGGTEFIPLLRTGDQGGTVEWRDTVQQSFMGIGGMNPRRRHFATGLEYTLAARIRGKAAAAPTPPASSDPAAPKPAATAPGELNVIVVADLDVISEQFFQLRARKVEGLDFDNVTFVLNCVDVLAGDESYVDLRKRRLRHRTLERIEAESTRFVLEGQKEEKLAESEADAQLAAAQKRLDDKVDALRKRTDLDERTKESMLLNVQEVENRRLTVEKTNIEDQKQRRVLAAKGEREREIRKIENRVRIVAMLVPPLPALALAVVVFLSRRGRENRGANPNRIA